MTLRGTSSSLALKLSTFQVGTATEGERGGEEQEEGARAAAAAEKGEQVEISSSFGV